MKWILFLLLFLNAEIFYGQFAIIADRDSSTNVREDVTKSSTIIDKLYNGHLVYILENKGNWNNINYTKKGKDLAGFIYKGNFKMISDFQTVPLKRKSNNSVTLAKDSVEIIIAETPFRKNAHQYKYYLDANTQIELIDKEKYWGTDGDLPKREYNTIQIKIGQTVIKLPNSALKNLYEPNLSTTLVNFDRDKNIIYIQAMNSDGAGGYEVVWKIENGVYKERFVMYGF